MQRNSRWFVVVLGLVVGFANLLYAQSSPTPANSDALLDVLQTLEAKGVLTQQEYDALKQRILEDQANAQQKAAPAPQVKTVSAQDTAAGQQPAQKVVTFMDNAVGIHAGRFDITISGEINLFYVHDRADRSAASCLVLCLAASGQEPSSSLRNGLLPGDLNVKIATKENGYDVAVYFGIWPEIQSVNQAISPNLNTGVPTGFGTPGIDFRQQFVTVGKAHMGTFKLGRDLGFFGQEAILNDMTLLGAGSTNGNNPAPGSVTLGRIGIGYLYTDFIPQISWTSPSRGGFQVAGGIFEPLNDVVSGPTALNVQGFSAPLTAHGQPMFQAKVNYTVPTKGRLKAKLWVNGLTQSMEAQASDLVADPALTIKAGNSTRANGIDYGGKFSFGAADLVVYGYNGSGIGTEGLLFLATSPQGSKRDSQGYYAQGTYTIAKKTTFGMSYGQSNLSLAKFGETPVTIANITRYNASYIGQGRYALTSWVNLVAEYTHTRSGSQAFKYTTDDSFALGTIVFF